MGKLFKLFVRINLLTFRSTHSLIQSKISCLGHPIEEVQSLRVRVAEHNSVRVQPVVDAGQIMVRKGGKWDASKLNRYQRNAINRMRNILLLCNNIIGFSQDCRLKAVFRSPHSTENFCVSFKRHLLLVIIGTFGNSRDLDGSETWKDQCVFSSPDK